ncbi:MAG: MoaD/ThiS family protein [Dethiobacteria bacterium]|nr:MoaD/ThiS family protein [Bacillota bacterium]
MISLEVRGFGKLYALFKERQWDNPLIFECDAPITAAELRDRLELPAADVEVVFINRVIQPMSTTLEDGDRIAFVPPGVPSIHRFNLGFYNVKE